MTDHDELSLVVRRLEKHNQAKTKISHTEMEVVKQIRNDHLKAKETLEQELEDRMKEVNIEYAKKELNIYDLAKNK